MKFSIKSKNQPVRTNFDFPLQQEHDSVNIERVDIVVKFNKGNIFQMEQENSCGAKPKLLDLFPSIQKVNQ